MTPAEPVVVQVGGQVWQVAAGSFSSNCYLHGEAASDGCVVIDPGLDPEGIDRVLTGLGKRPAAVLCTHGHFDHVGGAAYFQQKYSLPVYLPGEDIRTMKSSNFLLMALRIPDRITLPEITRVDTRGMPVEIDALSTSYTYLPFAGHTPGSCLVRCGDYLFSGDSLYARGVGLSHLPGEDRTLLRANLKGLLGTLPASLRVCPGHGPTAEFGEICRENKALLQFLQASD